MAIAAPGTLRLSGNNRPLPGNMVAALAAAGAVAVAAAGAAIGGTVPLTPVVDTTTRAAYWGYAIKPAGVGEQPTLANGAIVEGFTGVTAGSPVWIDDDGTLTHTDPGASAGIVEPVGIGVRTTAIYFFAR